LLYEDGANAATDRPAHIRAASGLARVNDAIALIQDDANFVALIDVPSGRARAIPLPVGEGGLRLFDRDRGNKEHKLDLEACVAVGSMLLAFGSGTTARREVAACVRFAGDEPDVRVVPLPAFYAALRRETSFAGSELNIEAAVILTDRLRLFSRGNGRASGALVAVNASCDVDLASFLAHLEAPERAAPPAPKHITAYELGAIRGTRLGFTDATPVGEQMLYSAAAELSPDAIEDGMVAGSAIGVIDVRGNARWTAVTDRGAPFLGKIEGILMHPLNDAQLLAVMDMDDPRIPSELCVIDLGGPWMAMTEPTTPPAD
jgi:hypothetical protein